jgi:hypothetical protein
MVFSCWLLVLKRRLGELLFAEAQDHADVAALRERVRKALAGLCGDAVISDTESELKGS